MTESILTQAELKTQLHYDSETGIFTSLKTNKHIGYKRPDGYVIITIKRKPLYAHRLAWLYVYGEFPKNCIDHINSNPNDNRICNLRDVKHLENNRNKKGLRKDNKSGFNGVDFYKTNKKWRARIKILNIYKHIGFFEKFEDACNAYLNYKKEMKLI